jgi:hypothetical protein
VALPKTVLVIRPPLPPNPRPPTYHAIGILFWVVAGLMIWWFGFWWGVVVGSGAFVLSGFVEGVNLASAAAESGEQAPRSRHGPPFAELHAAVSGFVAGLLGFGITAVVGLATSDGSTGIAAAAATSVALGWAVSWLLELDWSGALGSWFLLLIVSLLVGIPLAAYLAPGYRVHGVSANIATSVLVVVSELLVWRASPWRGRWRI